MHWPDWGSGIQCIPNGRDIGIQGGRQVGDRVGYTCIPTMYPSHMALGYKGKQGYSQPSVRLVPAAAGDYLGPPTNTNTTGVL